MAAKPKRRISIETQWLREYAGTYLPNEGAFEFSASALRKSGLSLIDVRHCFRTGTVVYSDKLDVPGALWIVQGEDCEGRRVSISVHVVSDIMSVILLEVQRVDFEGDDDVAA